MNNICHICEQSIGLSESILLVNWSHIHRSCYNFLINPEFTESKDLSVLYSQWRVLQSKIETQSWVIDSFSRLFNTEKKSLYLSLTEELSRNQQEVIALEKIVNEMRNTIKKELSKVYDFWYERPPDWSDRQESVHKIFHRKCCSCWSYKFLQVHHRLPINNWWAHNLENLILLCRDCHEDKHGWADFKWKYKTNSEESIFMGRLRKIDEAIKNSKDLYFHYKKYEGEASIRKISPIWTKMDGTSLCVFWYCHLREDDRVFAIRRMTEINIMERV